MPDLLKGPQQTSGSGFQGADAVGVFIPAGVVQPQNIWMGRARGGIDDASFRVQGHSAPIISAAVDILLPWRRHPEDVEFPKLPPGGEIIAENDIPVGNYDDIQIGR